MTFSALEHQRLDAFRASASRLVLQHARVRVNGAVASQQTVRLTHEVAMACCNELWELGFKLQDIRGLEGKHMRALVQSWYARGLKPKTIQNQISRLRRIASWIGKPDIVPRHHAAAVLVPEAPSGAFTVSTIAKSSKSWSENGIDVVAKIREADVHCRTFGAMLRMGVAFGLRRKEQIQIIPWRADGGDHLKLRGNVGKSGKERDIPIVHPFQRIALDHAKKIAGKGRYLGWPGRSLKQNEAHYAYMLRKIGVTGKDADCVGHGLRAEYCENAAMLLGLIPPTLGGKSGQMSQAEREAIQRRVSESMGHHRIDVTQSYYGSFRRLPVAPAQTYLEYRGYRMLVQPDLDARCLRGSVAGEFKEVQLMAATVDELEQQFHLLVQDMEQAQQRDKPEGAEPVPRQPGQDEDAGAGRAEKP